MMFILCFPASLPRATGVTLMGRRMRLATVEDTEGLGQHIRQHSGGVARGHGAWILVSGPAMMEVR